MKKSRKQKTTKASIAAKSKETASEVFAVSKRKVESISSHFCYTRLRVGDVFDILGGEYIAIMVNECRCKCVPTAMNQVSFKTRFGGVTEFTTLGDSESISPNSEVHIKARIGVAGVKQLLGPEIVAPIIVTTKGEKMTQTKSSKAAKASLSVADAHSVTLEAKKNVKLKNGNNHAPLEAPPASGAIYIAYVIDQKDLHPPQLVRTLTDFDAVTAAGKKFPAGTWAVKEWYADGARKPDEDTTAKSKAAEIKAGKRSKITEDSHEGIEPVKLGKVDYRSKPKFLQKGETWWYADTVILACLIAGEKDIERIAVTVWDEQKKKSDPDPWPMSDIKNNAAHIETMMKAQPKAVVKKTAATKMKPKAKGKKSK